jgi:rhodanese-related sulfurtransferase
MKKIIIVICVIGLMFVFSGLPINATTTENTSDNNTPLKLNDCHMNINVHETWTLLNNTGDGIQNPIDVRFKYEWNEGFIDTPWPEHPRWYSLSLLKTEDGLQAFMDMYAGDEVIIYCRSGSRSLEASQILCDAGFIGTVYNMLGGINTWKEGGYPVRTNTEPDMPEISGPSEGHPGEELTYIFSSQDAEGDDVYYWVDWNDTTTTEWTGPYVNDEEIILTHIWEEKGTYLIKAKTKDIFDEESDWSDLYTITIGNQPPTAPNISGPIHGKVGVEYYWTFVSIDPDENDVYYSVQWAGGCGSQNWGPYPSGEEITLNHTYYQEGIFTIYTQAIDIYGAESNWSTFEVTIPRNKVTNNPFLNRLQSHPYLFPLLQTIIQQLGL